MAPSAAEGKLTVITGPSGVGKGSLVKQLLELHPEIWLSISATTREARQGEIEGDHYFFLNRDRFAELVQAGGCLEWAEFAGNFYGTPIKQVEKKLKDGRPVLLEIELEGARQVRKSFSQALHIFLAPPSLDELENRIRGRATDSEEAIQKRLLRAKQEILAQNEFDAVVINDVVDKSVLELEKKMGLSKKH